MSAQETLTTNDWVDVLCRCFSSDSVDIRIKAASDVAHLQSRAIAEILDNQLQVETSAFVRATLVKSLAAVGRGEYVKSVIKALDDEDERVRANAIEALSLFRDSPVVVAHILKGLRDPEERVRTAAHTILPSVDAKVIGQAIRKMAKSKNREFRRVAMHLLRKTIGDRFSGEPAQSEIAAPAKDESREQRVRRNSGALDGLQVDLTKSTVMSLASPLLEDSQLSIRREAVEAIRKMARDGVRGAEEALQSTAARSFDDDDIPTDDMSSVRGRLNHWETDVRINEIEMLVAERDSSNVHLLVERCRREEDPLVIRKLLDAMGKLGGPAQRSVIVEHLHSGTLAVRIAAIDALDSLGDSESLTHLERLLNDSNHRVRAQCVVILVKHGRIEAEEYIDNLLESTESESLLAALSIIRHLPNAAEYHDRLVEIHEMSADKKVKSAVQEVEKALVRSGQIKVPRLTEPPKPKVKAAPEPPEWLMLSLKAASMVLVFVLLVLWQLIPEKQVRKSDIFDLVEGPDDAVSLFSASVAMKKTDLARRLLSTLKARKPPQKKVEKAAVAVLALARNNDKPACSLLSEQGLPSPVFSPLIDFLIDNDRIDEAQALLKKYCKGKGSVDAAFRISLILERKGQLAKARDFLGELSKAGLISSLLRGRYRTLNLVLNQNHEN